MKHLYTTLIAILIVGIGMANAQITVDASAGTPSAGYTTLKSAFDAINIGTHQGVIDIRVHTATIETASAMLVESGNVSGASYTSILIRPADTATVVKTITTSTAATVLVDLNGADNVTIDGRPLSTGSSALLEFNNTTASATNLTIRFVGGATNNTLRYIRSLNSGAATGSNVNIHFVTQSGVLIPNGNNSILNSTIQGGRNAISIDDTLSIGTMAPITIRSNSIVNFGLAGINVSSSSGFIPANFARIETLIIDSNQIYYDAAFSSVTSPRGIQFTTTNSTKAYNLTVTKNRIYGIKSTQAAGTLIAALITPGTNAASQINMINNSICLLDPNNTINGTLFGVYFQGTGSVNFKLYHNTIRIGGAAVGGTAGATTVRSGCLYKPNSGVSTVFSVRNNIFINTRTGGASTTNVHIGAWYSNVTGTLDINYNNYQGVGYIVGWAGFVYGGVVGAYQTAAVPNETNSIVKATFFSSTTQPYLTGTSLADADLSAVLIPSIASDIDNNPRGTLQTAVYKGAHEAPNLFITNDLATTIIYTYGKIPLGTAEGVRARIRNNGTVMVTSPTITLDIYGANSVTLTLPLTGISPGADTIITFPSFTPSILGFDSLRVFVPIGDQNTTNDTAIWVRENTLNALSYSRPFQAQTGNLGNNGFGEIIAKFNTPVGNFVNQVNVNFTNAFFTTPLPYQVVIYPDSGGVLGPKKNPLWVSAPQQTFNGVANISAPSVVVNAGYFYVGVRQTSASNVGFAYQTENPIRTNTMYYRQSSASMAAVLTSIWNDFAPNNFYRFMIEPRLKINNDIGVVNVAIPQDGCVSGNPSQTISVAVQNLGLLGQNFGMNTLMVSGTITSPSSVVTSFGPVIVSSGTLDSDSILNVALTGTYNMSAPGNYVIKAWTSYSLDNNAINDTTPNITRTVTVPITSPYIQNFDTATVFPTNITTNRFAVSTGTGYTSSKSARVNLYNLNTATANAIMVLPRVTNITSSSQFRFEYKITDFTGGAATILGTLDSINILVSTDCGLSYTPIYSLVGSGHTPSTNFATISIPLGAYAGQDIRMKIQCDWLGTLNDAFVDLDNIRILSLTDDLSARSASQPCSSILQGSSAAPMAIFKNSGSTTLSSASFNFVITGPGSYTGTGTAASLTPDSMVSITFSPVFNPTVTGTYTAKVYSSLATDSDPLNDTLIYTFTVVNPTQTNAGNALVFSGTSFAQVANSQSININTNSLTVEAWILRDAAGTGNRTIISKDSSILKGQYALWVNLSNNLVFSATTSAGSNAIVSTNLIPSGTWTHVAGVYDGTSMTLYINGKLEASVLQTGTIVPAASALNIGQNYASSDRFVGRIDELKIWNTARTPHDIRQNIHTRLANASSANLVGYYRMDEGSGSVVIDASGNCNSINLALGGSPTWAVATYPLTSTPVVAMNQVATDGIGYAFTNTNITLAFTGITSSDSIYIHKFAGAPIGTSPLTSPGGATALYGNYWIAYKYGTGTFSSVDLNTTFGAGNLNSGVVNADLVLFSRENGSNGAWTTTTATTTSVSFASQSATFTNATTSIFDKQLSIGGNNNPLPVELLYFTAKGSAKNVNLNWATASEIDNAGFHVERSFDGKNFKEIAFVKGMGNSSKQNNYGWVDENAFTVSKSNKLYYRLVQTDFSGKQTISNIEIVVAGESKENAIAVYPNPFTAEMNIHIDASNTADAQIRIVDITGKNVLTLTSGLNKGVNTIETAGLASLSKGVYFVQVTINGETSTYKLMKQ